MHDGLRDHGDQPFDVRSAVRPAATTFADMRVQALTLAQGLRDRGVEAGDVVGFQLPNWVYAAATFYATAFLGAVVVPIVHFYGAKEVDYILRSTAPDVVVTVDRFGHNDHLATYETLHGQLQTKELERERALKLATEAQLASLESRMPFCPFPAGALGRRLPTNFGGASLSLICQKLKRFGRCRPPS